MAKRDTTDIWAWIREDSSRLEREGGAKQAIVDGWSEFWGHYDNNFDAADFAISGAIEAAKAGGELRWQLLLRHWRLQLWTQDDVRRALPEAVDLLTLATDERVRDVPQRICAYHDLVDCHVRMDSAGYYEDILANSQDVLAQLPTRHSCADCARSHAATAAAEAGRTEDARHWLAQFQAHIASDDPGWDATSLAEIYELLADWKAAETQYRRMIEEGRKAKRTDRYLAGVQGLARTLAAQGDVSHALEALVEARHMAKYTRGARDLARMMEVEAYVAEAAKETNAALDYFTRAAHNYLDLGRYRQSALLGLHAADLAQQNQLPEPSGALDVVARAAGLMPPASQDVVARLRAFGRSPLAPREEQPEPLAQGEPGTRAPAAEGERKVLEDALAGHVANGNVRATAFALYRLGRWHAEHEAPRAAVDYLIANAVLERLLELPMDDREDALGGLQHLREQLPAGTVEAALTAAESGPPAMVASMLAQMSPARWRWLVRAVATEAAGETVIEPEPQEAYGFEDWLEHVASMTALILRFSDRADPVKRAQWAKTLDETADEMNAQVGPNGEGREVVALARGLAALAQGTDPQQVRETVPPPFTGLVDQLVEIAKHPVWQHPGCSPLEFLVERSAQRAVRSLRIQDDHRATRMSNLAWRFQLMAMDLFTHDELKPLAHFHYALGELMITERLPEGTTLLEAPFDSMLAAVFEAGKVKVTQPPQG